MGSGKGFLEQGFKGAFGVEGALEVSVEAVGDGVEGRA